MRTELNHLTLNQSNWEGEQENRPLDQQCFLDLMLLA